MAKTGRIRANFTRLLAYLLFVLATITIVAQSMPVSEPATKIAEEPANFVNSDEEFEKLIAGLEQEARDFIQNNPENYLSDELSIDELILLEESQEDQQSTELPVVLNNDNEISPPEVPLANQQLENSIDLANQVDYLAHNQSDVIGQALQTPGEQLDQVEASDNIEETRATIDPGLLETAAKSETEFNMILEKLKLESEHSIENPENFLRDDVDMSKILELIDELEADCGICRENLRSEPYAGFRTCRHMFHVDCLQKFLLHNKWSRNNICPYCRIDFNIEDVTGPTIDQSWIRHMKRGDLK